MRVSLDVRCHPMYLDVFVNGTLVSTFGHEHSENLSVSVIGYGDELLLNAGAVCSKNNDNFHLSWSPIELTLSDEVTISKSENGVASAHEKSIEMGRTDRKAWDNHTCEWCQKTGSEVERLIPGDSNRPGICSECVGLCNQILSSDT